MLLMSQHYLYWIFDDTAYLAAIYLMHIVIYTLSRHTNDNAAAL